jgi:hypothetical protein
LPNFPPSYKVGPRWKRAKLSFYCGSPIKPSKKRTTRRAPAQWRCAVSGFAVVAVLTIVAILSSGWQIAANAADNPGEGNGVTQTVDDGSGKPMRVTFVIRIGRPPAHHPSTANWRVHRRCG